MAETNAWGPSPSTGGTSHAQNTDTQLIRSNGEALTADAIFAGLGGGSLRYEHIQPNAVAVDTVAHNLGKFPTLEVRDELGRRRFPGVTHLDENRTELTFNPPLAYRAVFLA